MPMRVRSGRSFASDRCETCSPSTVTVPEVGFSSPLIMRMRVDLPAPEKPITPNTSPRLTVKETSSTALTAPSRPSKTRLTWSKTITGSPGAPSTGRPGRA